MKRHFTIFLLFTVLASLPAFGQTSLLLARTFIHVDETGSPYIGDSTTLNYNSQLLVNQYKTWKIDATGDWVLKSRAIDHAYDANGTLLYYLLQKGDDISGWTDSYRYNYTYDVVGHELSYLEEKWNGTMWVMQWSVNRVYDANGNLMSTAGTGFRYLLNYDAQNLLLTKTYQERVNSNWVDKTRYDYTYLPNSTTETTYNWTNNAWIESSRSTDTFDANGNLIQNLYEQWNGTAWVNSLLELHSYDVNGNILHDLTQGWNGTDWENNFLTDYTYNAENNLTYWIAWNYVNGSWEGSSRQFNGYDDENHFISAKTEFSDGTSWFLISYGDFYYSDFVSTHTPAPAEFKIFPNPASTSVTLKSEGLRHAKIFDQQGRLVGSQSLQGQTQETLQLGNLSPGNYLLEVLGNDGKVGAKTLQIRR